MKQLRQLGFNLKDMVAGSQVQRNRKEIKDILKNPFEANAIRIREENLKRLLKHASHTTTYYRPYRDLYLNQFPVITKTEIQKSFEAFKSEPLNKKPIFKVSTSGSTGVPFILYHNSLKRKRNTADVLYFMGETGYEIGNALIELEVWRGHNQRSRLRNFLHNTLQFDVTNLSDQRIEELLAHVARKNGFVYMLGFASAFETICQYMERTDRYYNRTNIRGITATSEYLNEYTRETLNKRFKAPVYSRYSNEEIGILAHQTHDSDMNFVLNWASYVFEILDIKEDRPASKGELGRIVVTDLFNYAMPMIRYDTGDVGMFCPDFPDNRYMSSVEGRKMDLVTDTKGVVLSSFVVYTMFYPYYKDLNQYQFIQEGARKYKVKLNVKESFDKESELIEAVRKDFGQDALVDIEYVDEIPALASGKRRKVINSHTARS